MTDHKTFGSDFVEGDVLGEDFAGGEPSKGFWSECGGEKGDVANIALAVGFEAIDRRGELLWRDGVGVMGGIYDPECFGTTGEIARYDGRFFLYL